MLSVEERKTVLRAMRTEAVIMISQESDDAVKRINESDMLVRDLVIQLWENTLRRLRREGFAELCEQSKLKDFDYQHRFRTIIGSMQVAYADLRDPKPVEAYLPRLVASDAAWQEQKSRSKRMKALDAESLPKRVRTAQYQAAGSSRHDDTAGTGAIMRTVFNAQCTHLIGIPHEALVEGRSIGAGAFGEVKEYTVQGLSFLPEHITYCGKHYKGDGSAKFESFQVEQGMQVLHPTIVRCIAFTKEAPWITLFPYYNGGSLGDLLLKIPFKHSEFTRAMFRMQYGWRRLPPDDLTPDSLTLARIRAVVVSMPHIMHALVDGMMTAHMAGILHTDLHPFNVVLDFTKDMLVRVGIIDWGLLLRAPKKRSSLNFVSELENVAKVADAKAYADREQRKRGWLAPELYDYTQANAYTPASDVFAIGYMLEILYDFCNKAQELWFPEVNLDRITLDAVHFRAKNWMLMPMREERKTLSHIVEFFKSLATDPARVQRPLVELSVSFTHM